VAISNIIPSLVEVFEDEYSGMDDRAVSAVVQLAKHGKLHPTVFTTMLMNVYSGTSYGNWLRHSIVYCAP
jgi:hypothetical protein